jgi:hypothetical protein
MGDLNSDYNEQVSLSAPGSTGNDTNGTTGINTVLRAQGDELKVAKGLDLTLKYNLHYELDRADRRTAWYDGFGWNALDNMIIGSGMYDKTGISYVDNSFQIANATLPRLSFLFNADGTPHRWIENRRGSDTQHEVGGYSDHTPIFARFNIWTRQSTGTIWLGTPGRPDKADIAP